MSNLVHQISAAVDKGDIAFVRAALMKNHQLIEQKDSIRYWLKDAARRNNIAMIELLTEFGADIHEPSGVGSPPSKEGIIEVAAGAGAYDVVKWLLSQGANVNFTYEDYPGESRCTTLVRAAYSGHFELVKLLVEEGGANVNALWWDTTPLSYAIMYGQKKIEAYLRSKGALEPWQIKGENPPGTVKNIHEHLKKNLGKVKPLSLHEIVPGDPPITIHVVQRKKKPPYVTLVTEGMSSKPMTVPEGGQDYQYAELLMYLPAWWSEMEISAPENTWILEWLRRLARYPHEHNTWLGGPNAVIANGEPPAPLAEGVPFTCLLALEVPDLAPAILPDGRKVVFYMVYPLYTDERDYEKAHGTQALMKLLQDHGFPICVEANRENVVAEEADFAEMPPPIASAPCCLDEPPPPKESKKPKRKKKK